MRPCCTGDLCGLWTVNNGTSLTSNSHSCSPVKQKQSGTKYMFIWMWTLSHLGACLNARIMHCIWKHNAPCVVVQRYKVTRWCHLKVLDLGNKHTTYELCYEPCTHQKLQQRLKFMDRCVYTDKWKQYIPCHSMQGHKHLKFLIQSLIFDRGSQTKKSETEIWKNTLIRMALFIMCKPGSTSGFNR